MNDNSTSTHTTMISETLCRAIGLANSLVLELSLSASIGGHKVNGIIDTAHKAVLGQMRIGDCYMYTLWLDASLGGGRL